MPEDVSSVLDACATHRAAVDALREDAQSHQSAVADYRRDLARALAHRRVDAILIGRVTPPRGTLARKQRLHDAFAADPFTLVNATHFSRVTVDGKLYKPIRVIIR